MKLLPSSPVISAGADSVFEMVEAFGVSHYDLPVRDLRDVLDGIMAITTDPEVLYDHKPCSWACVQQTEGDGQPLAVVAELLFLHFLLQIVVTGFFHKTGTC
uniref:Uncharacterized protein n=1 Tax=Oryza rufipogon TaxID=4529 RepID=A0A0E0R1X1_ORYRU